MQNICPLFPFYKATGGNWRNAIHISCSCEICPYTDSPNCGGYLLSTNSEGEPMIVSVKEYGRITGEPIDPSECMGQITRQVFEVAYAQYILWRMPNVQLCPLWALNRRYTCSK